MKLKKMIALLLVIVLAFSLWGCGSTNNETSKNDSADAAAEATVTPATTAEATATAVPEATVAPADEKTVLRMAWWGSQTRHDRTVAVIELYMEQNPNIEIQFEYYDYEGYFNKLNTLVASNEVWDIFQLGSNFPTYIDKIYLLNDAIANGTIDVSGTNEAFLRIAADENGQQVGLCSGVNTYGIAYDPAMFAEAGVAEPTENWTWADFAAACETIHEKLGIYGSSKLDDWVAGASMYIAQEGFGTGFFKSDNSGLGFEDYTMLTDYMQMRADLVASGSYPDPGALAEITDIENDFLVTGEAAMTWVASNQFIALSDAAGKELKLINPPRQTADGPAGVTIQSSQMLCASSDSKNPEEAAKFIAFFQSNIEANQILLGERGIPTFAAVREALSANLTETEKAVYDYVDLVGTFETGDTAVNPASPACTDSIKEQQKYLLDKVIYGEMTADAAALELFNFATGCEY